MRYAEHKQRLIDALFGTPGHVGAGLRRAVQERAAALAGPGGGKPVGARAELAPVATYVDKVALHAYLVTDADVDALKRGGYSEDAIFEITLSAALGAGLGRLERGLAALRGDA